MPQKRIHLHIQNSNLCKNLRLMHYPIQNSYLNIFYILLQLDISLFPKTAYVPKNVQDLKSKIQYNLEYI